MVRELREHMDVTDQAADYADQPFAAGPDMVLQQVGWIDTLTHRLLRLDERVTVGDFAKLGRLRAVYEVNGNHYRDPQE